jgi:hypothetical protein
MLTFVSFRLLTRKENVDNGRKGKGNLNGFFG